MRQSTVNSSACTRRVMMVSNHSVILEGRDPPSVSPYPSLTTTWWHLCDDAPYCSRIFKCRQRRQVYLLPRTPTIP